MDAPGPAILAFSRRVPVAAMAKLQVELAPARVLWPRLRSRWTHLSRTAAVFGRRRPLNTQPRERTRRRIRTKISVVKKRLKGSRGINNLAPTNARAPRRDSARRPALVGYTNAGKSSLLKPALRAGRVHEDRLFATVDTLPLMGFRRRPTANRLTVYGGVHFFFFATLPPTISVASFRRNVGRSEDADLLLHVTMRAMAGWEDQLERRRNRERRAALPKRVIHVL